MAAETWSIRPKLIAKQLDQFDADIASLHLRKNQLILHTVMDCSHPLESIYELPYTSEGWLGITRPWLICSECGYTEEGWGCGYRKLRHAEYAGVPKISREAWDRLATIKIRQGDKCPS